LKPEIHLVLYCPDRGLLFTTATREPIFGHADYLTMTCVIG
jgi:hypothetical protein